MEILHSSKPRGVCAPSFIFPSPLIPCHYLTLPILIVASLPLLKFQHVTKCTGSIPTQSARLFRYLHLHERWRFSLVSVGLNSATQWQIYQLASQRTPVRCFRYVPDLFAQELYFYAFILPESIVLCIYGEGDPWISHLMILFSDSLSKPHQFSCLLRPLVTLPFFNHSIDGCF